MVACQIQAAARFAFPRGPTAVEDRQMSLTLACRESAGYTAHLISAAKGRDRKGAPSQDFTLCQNHEELLQQIDDELVSEGWSSCRGSRSTSLY